MEALQSQLRAQSPHMSREVIKPHQPHPLSPQNTYTGRHLSSTVTLRCQERLRLEMLMAKLQDRHKGLATAAAREAKVYEADQEM